jgi:multicomponent Na+:H+ antiporter subunit F
MITKIPLLNQDLLILLAMIIASLISVAGIGRCKSMPERIAVATSFGSKIAIFIIAYGVFREDWMIGSIGAIILISGDAGMVILSLTELQE